MISKTLMNEISLLQTSDCRRVISEEENQFPQGVVHILRNQQRGRGFPNAYG